MVGGRLVALLVVATAAGAAAGAVANASPPHAPRLTPHTAFAPAAGPRCPIPQRFRGAFAAAARDTGLPLALLVAVSEIESNFEPEAVSAAGARGLLQLMPTTAAELKLDPDHPPSNVLAGARYLRQMLDRFESADLALAAYNAGPTAVDEADGVPPVTSGYVTAVTARWRELAGCR